MPMPRLSALLLLLCSFTFAQEGPRLGIPASSKEVAGWDISIGPEGDNLPFGSGTSAQGASIYVTQCFACHGPNGEGGLEPKLVGGHGTIDTANAVKTVGSYWPYATTVFDYIRRSMPFQLPGSLTDNEVYALTAYLLEMNGIIDEDTVLNADTLPTVEMPNRDGFFWAWEE
ncbi:MAG: c-type cytochrome [Pseudomonadales bacterium]